MKKKFLMIALLLVGICSVMLFGQIKSAKAGVHVLMPEPGNGAGYYLEWENNCKKCLSASTSCNVSSQCCRSWGDCN